MTNQTTAAIDAGTRHHIAGTSLANGGGTFYPETGETPTAGFAVTVAVLDKVAQEDLLLAVHNFQQSITPGNYLGTWFDDENGCWEISDTAVFADHDSAMTLAATLGERYIYDLAEAKCLAVA